MENALISCVTYVAQTIWPARLAIYYPYPQPIAAGQATAALILIAAISWAALRTWRIRPYIAVGWFWYLGTLVPVIGLVQVGSAALANRYTYIPSIGFFIAVVFLLEDFVARVQMPKTIAAGIAAVILTGCLLATDCLLYTSRCV